MKKKGCSFLKERTKKIMLSLAALKDRLERYASYFLLSADRLNVIFLLFSFKKEVLPSFL
jgi:hypothetical protein